MRIALIECPVQPLAIDWKDVYFPDAVFPIDDFLHDEPNELRVWDYLSDPNLTISALVQELQAYQPVILGISDNHSTNGLLLERLIKQMFPRALVFFSPGQIDPEQLLDKANQSAFRLRQRTRTVAGKMRFRSAWSDQQLLDILKPCDSQSATNLIDSLESQFKLLSWRQYLPVQAYAQVLETLELLTDCYPQEHPIWDLKQIRILDVGAARWAYAPALYQFFVHAYATEPRQVFLTGIELDPYRLDSEGYSCADYALSYMDPVANQTRYLNQDVLSYEPKHAYDMVCLFRPFMTKQEHLFGGLPLEYYKPQAMIEKLRTLLQPQGVLLLSHSHPETLPDERLLMAEIGIEPYVHAAFCSCLSQRVRGFISLIAAG